MGGPAGLALACQLDASALVSAQPTPELCDYEKGTGLTRTRPLTESLCVSLPLPIAHQTHTYAPPSPHMPIPLEPSSQAAPQDVGGRGAQVFFGLMRRGEPRAQSRQPSGGSMSGRIEARTGPRDKQLPLLLFVWATAHAVWSNGWSRSEQAPWSKEGQEWSVGELPRWGMMTDDGRGEVRVKRVCS